MSFIYRRENAQRKSQVLKTTTETTTENTPHHKTSKMPFKGKLNFSFKHNTAKTAPAKDSTLQNVQATNSTNNDTQKKNSFNLRRPTVVHRTDNGYRRNTIWSDTVDVDLVANLSPKELNRQEVLFEIIKTEHE